MIGSTNATQIRPYMAGDVVDLTGFTTGGFVTSGATGLFFFIPVNRPIQASTASLSGTVSLRTTSGTYAASNVSITSLGTITISLRDTGVYVNVNASSAFSATNNTPIAVYGEYGFKMTFA